MLLSGKNRMNREWETKCLGFARFRALFGQGIGRMLAEALVANGEHGLGWMVSAMRSKRETDADLSSEFAGAKVYIASRKESVLKQVCDEINSSEGATGSCHYLVTNLSSKADCYKLADDLKAAGETKLHILANNSGITWGSPLEDFPEKEGWDKLMALNVKCMFYLTTACLPLLEAAGKAGGNKDPARVINVSSVASVSPVISGLGAAGTVTPSCEQAMKREGNGVFEPRNAHFSDVESFQTPRRRLLSTILRGHWPDSSSARTSSSTWVARATGTVKPMLMFALSSTFCRPSHPVSSPPACLPSAFKTTAIS